MGKLRYDIKGEPPRSVANAKLYTACVIARRFAHRLPTPAELMDEYNMSRATAYRWFNALKASRGAEG